MCQLASRILPKMVQNEDSQSELQFPEFSALAVIYNIRLQIGLANIICTIEETTGQFFRAQNAIVFRSY